MPQTTIASTVAKRTTNPIKDFSPPSLIIFLSLSLKCSTNSLRATAKINPANNGVRRNMGKRAVDKARSNKNTHLEFLYAHNDNDTATP